MQNYFSSLCPGGQVWEQRKVVPAVKPRWDAADWTWQPASAWYLGKREGFAAPRMQLLPWGSATGTSETRLTSGLGDPCSRSTEPLADLGLLQSRRGLYPGHGQPGTTWGLCGAALGCFTGQGPWEAGAGPHWAGAAVGTGRQESPGVPMGQAQGCGLTSICVRVGSGPGAVQGPLTEWWRGVRWRGGGGPSGVEPQGAAVRQSRGGQGCSSNTEQEADDGAALLLEDALVGHGQGAADVT